MFGKDPRDVTIEHMQGEIQYLRDENAKLRDRLIALTNPAVFTVVTRSEKPAPTPDDVEGKEAIERLRGRLRVPFRPEKTDQQIHAEFRKEA